MILIEKFDYYDYNDNDCDNLYFVVVMMMMYDDKS